MVFDFDPIGVDVIYERFKPETYNGIKVLVEVEKFEIFNTKNFLNDYLSVVLKYYKYGFCYLSSFDNFIFDIKDTIMGKKYFRLVQYLNNYIIPPTNEILLEDYDINF